ncbi:hypothetical protein IJG72_02255 [bacterium]|nr:hypothetical protein [bacterium]
MFKVAKAYIKEHPVVTMFTTFFILYFTLGLYFCFSNKVITLFYDVIFDIDCVRFNKLLYENYAPDNSIFKHPFSITILRPIFFLTQAFCNSIKTGGILLLALCGSGTVCMVYLTIKKLIKDKNIALPFSLIFGLSFSTLIFSSNFELYIYSAFISSILLFYIIELWDDNKSIQNIDIFIMSVLLFLSYGITLITALHNFVLILFLIMHKNSKFSLFSKNIFKHLALILTMFGVFYLIFDLSFGQAKNIFDLEYDKNYISNDFNFSHFFAAAKVLFVQCFYAIKMEFVQLRSFNIGTGLVFATKQHPVLFAPAILFFTTAFVGFIKKIKNIKYLTHSIVLPILIISVLNFIEWCMYNCEYSFLFSQNLMIYLIILLAVSFSVFSDKFTKYFCYIFLLWQCFSNIFALVIIKTYLKKIHIANFALFKTVYNPNLFVYFIYAVISAILIHTTIFILKKFMKKEILQTSIKDKIIFFTSLTLAYILIVGIFSVMFQGKA